MLLPIFMMVRFFIIIWCPVIIFGEFLTRLSTCGSFLSATLILFAQSNRRMNVKGRIHESLNAQRKSL